MKTIFYSILFILFVSTHIHAQKYNWPCAPFDQQHWINGTFCENRISGSIMIDHFHNGVDIDLAQGNNVYSVINGSVTSMSTVGINAYVRVGRYAYVHVDPSPAMGIGTPVTAFQTVLGTTNSWNHIHFTDGYVGSEINALRSSGGLDPFVDNYLPNVDWIKFYANGTTNEFVDKRVSGPVEIVARARDKTDNGPIGDNNGIYKIGYQIYDSSGTTPVTEERLRYQFDQKPSNAYVTNVYFYGSNLSTYIYNLTNNITSDGYWDTRLYEAGTYQIRVFTEDTRNNINERWQSLEIVAQDIWPPEIPVIKTLTGDDAGNWTLNWQKNDSSDIKGYRFYFAYDPPNWLYQPTISVGISPGDSTLEFTGFGNDVTIYFRLAAFDSAAIPNVSDTSDAYGVRLSAQGARALIVDGFDRIDGYWPSSAHSFITTYGEILSELDFAFNSCANEALINGSIQLNDYEVVFYLLGDEAGETEALSHQEQELIRQYLQNGGILIISGSDIGKDLVENGSEADSLFFTQFLRAQYLSDNSDQNGVFAVQGSFLEGWDGQVQAPAGRILAADMIAPVESETLLTFGNGNVAAVYYQGMFPGGSTAGSLVYCTFPIEIIADSDDRFTLVSGILDEFNLVSAINPVNRAALPREFSLSNFPNPFNPSTQIRYTLPGPARIKLTIYNINGQIIKSLYSGAQTAGQHLIFWDGTDRFGKEVSSGIYIYRLQTDDLSLTKKMMFLK